GCIDFIIKTYFFKHNSTRFSINQLQRYIVYVTDFQLLKRIHSLKKAFCRELVIYQNDLMYEAAK
ncbi:MAG: hypothetical protein AAFY41_16690, partial [Bacteroidota bacterium]